MEELAAAHGWFMTRQFENEANPDYHSRTTAREILDDFAGDRLDYWVTGYGTGGTLKGVARVLRKERPETKIIVCEPEDAPLLGSGIEQARKPDGTPAAPHPSFKPHPMQGWTPDFIPKLTGDAVDMKLIDRLLPIPGPEAIRCSKELATKEGIFVGITSGATFAGALKVAAEAQKGANILCMLPDTGERYLSTPLFADVAGGHERGGAGDLALDAERPAQAGLEVDHVAQEAAVRRVLVVQPARAVVVLPGVPVQARPLARLASRRPASRSAACRRRRAQLRVHEQVLEIAHRRERPGVFVDDVIGDADHAVARRARRRSRAPARPGP